MVQRIRIRGHVIRLYRMRPTTSRKRPETCLSCGAFYNDGSHRKCAYLCCGFVICLNCIITRFKYYCPEMVQRKRKSRKYISKDFAHWSSKTSTETTEVTTQRMEQKKIISGKNEKTEIGKPNVDSSKNIMEVDENSEKIKIDANSNNTILNNNSPDVLTSNLVGDLSKITNDCVECSSLIKTRLKLLIPKCHLKPVVQLERKFVENYKNKTHNIMTKETIIRRRSQRIKKNLSSILDEPNGIKIISPRMQHVI